MKIRPINDWVLIRPSSPDDKSPGGIVIPDSAKEKATRGKVLAAGRGRVEEERDKQGRPTGEKHFVETEVKKGQEVLFRKYGVEEFTVEGETLFLVRESDIIGTF
ncbi:MAG: co-chaperone GroES [bacterium]|nr:co-chaperone GroES [bacterium]